MFPPCAAMNHGLEKIILYIRQKSGLNFSGNRPAMIARRVENRMSVVNQSDLEDYRIYLEKNPDELNFLINELTINVSRFFRDTLTFELIADRILPVILQEKLTVSPSLRVWCVGCAKGEEPYSLAILIHEMMLKEKVATDVHIFATDIDVRALKGAEKAVYPPSSVEDIKYRLLKKYFTMEGTSFRLIPEIKKLVKFTPYDILDKKYGVPRESVFGSFDMVLCRNLSIYFNPEYQEIIFEKLHHSLAQKGYLILGESETPPMMYRHHFSRMFDFSPIYRKR